MQVAAGRTTYYVGGVYEYSVESGVVTETTFAGGDVLLRQTEGTRQVRYLHRDQLGSIDTITDEAGKVVERHGFDPFGKPVASDWQDTGGFQIARSTKKAAGS
jgi:hypothetical protein